MIKTLLFLREISICVFFAVAVNAARKINTELFELSGLPEKPGQNSTSHLPAALIKFSL
jgi:hypothetical protein